MNNVLYYADNNVYKILQRSLLTVLLYEFYFGKLNFLGGNFWWEESEEPWQTLAACIEIRDAINSGDPHNFCSHLPIHQVTF